MRLPLFRLAALFGLVLAGLMPLARPAGAADQAYTITGIALDRSAATATEARDKALADGQRLAWGRLLDRIVTGGPADGLRALPDRDLSALVAGFAVEEERPTATRYLATLTYRFQPAAVREALRRAGVSFVEGQSRPVLVLPLLRQSGSAPLLWEDSNEWRRAWQALGQKRTLAAGLVPLVLPVGDSADAAAVDPARLASGTADIGALLRRYGAIDWLSVEAARDAAGNGAGLSLIVSGAGGAMQSPLRETLTPQADEAPEALLARAIARTVELIDARWKQEAAARPASDQTAASAGGPVNLAAGGLMVRVALTGIEDWRDVQQRLAAVPLVRGVTVRALTRSEGWLSLDVADRGPALVEQLRQRGLIAQPPESHPPESHPPASQGDAPAGGISVWALRLAGSAPTSGQ